MSETATEKPLKQEEPKSESPVPPVIEEAFITQVEVVLPSSGAKKTIHKMKAGQYYQAQKVYVFWLEKLEKVLDASKIDFSKALDADGKPDTAKLDSLIGERGKSSIEATIQVANEATEKGLELLSLALGETPEEINENYYPEDIDVLMTGVMKVNNFMQNLKKSVAPTAGLGA
jgi:hypothetical protein